MPRPLMIQIVPGVGLHKDQLDARLFEALRGRGHTVEFYNWSHIYNPPIYEQYFNTFGWRKNLRDWLAEVIFDFQQVTSAIESIPLPEADVYIGHSAGSVIVTGQTQKPVCIMGSPVALIGEMAISLSTIRPQDVKNIPHILNIINENDPLAFPLSMVNVSNWIFKAKFDPVSAHMCYWNNKKVCRKVIQWTTQISLIS